MDGSARQKQRIIRWVVALLLCVAVIYGVTFIKLPGWLPALK